VGPDPSAGGYGRRHGSLSRAASLLALALVAFGLAGWGCGNSGHGAETDPEKGSDAAILNDALARELALLGVYDGGHALLHGPELAVGRQLRAQEQEYVDALTKAIRGLGGDTEAEAEELDLSGVEDRTALLTREYELESAALAFYEDAAPRLDTAAPRTLDAALAAGHAQHLVVLRQGLGAGVAGSVPDGFDRGELPPPGGNDPGGGG
jgi:Ferritin-like domain